MFEIRPIFRDPAFRYVAEHHRHNDPPEGWLFGVSVWEGEQICGVGIVSRPTGRLLQDARTVEITRVCTPSVSASRNTCSMIYARLCRAAEAIGYQRAVTYTLEGESAASVRAAGFIEDGLTPARGSLETGGRRRFHDQVEIFPSERRPKGAKVRWVRWLKP